MVIADSRPPVRTGRSVFREKSRRRGRKISDFAAYRVLTTAFKRRNRQRRALPSGKGAPPVFFLFFYSARMLSTGGFLQ